MVTRIYAAIEHKINI